MGIALCRAFSEAGLREFKSIRENFGKISIPWDLDTDSHLRVAVFFWRLEPNKPPVLPGEIKTIVYAINNLR